MIVVHPQPLFGRGGEPLGEQNFFLQRHSAHSAELSVVAPGGIGTVLESMMIWQLLQVRHLHDTPLVFVGPMWRELVEWEIGRASCRERV